MQPLPLRPSKMVVHSLPIPPGRGEKYYAFKMIARLGTTTRSSGTILVCNSLRVVCVLILSRQPFGSMNTTMVG